MENKEIFITKNVDQTKRAGELLAKELLLNKSKRGSLVLSLNGYLGGGKTTFLQGFAKGLGLKEKILSPTFVILKRFKLTKNKNYNNFYHIDCYRIQNSKEMLSLGIKEILKDPKNIVGIEWAERIKNILPKEVIILQFDVIEKDKRKLTLKYND
ncbi:MAG: tRNA (adenosine(37)-N6)-threonylcarbamoyltransferase complex ATPase subunit type 1 TsaE [Candidatus Nealsonbacteria bacterium]